MKRLINANSIEYFKTNEITDISLVLTSPSYYTNNNNGEVLKGEVGKGEINKVYEFSKYVNSITKVFEYIIPNLTENGTIILVVGRYKRDSVKDIVELINDKFITWGLNVVSNKYFGKYSDESILIYSKKKMNISTPNFEVLQNYNTDNKFGVLDSKLLVWAIESFSNSDELVVDPYAGGGSTVKKAHKLGRNGLGIEINYQYFK